MRDSIKTTMLAIVLLLGVGLVAVAGFVWSGAYNVGADDPHLPATYAVMEKMRQRSIAARAGKLEVPVDLQDEGRIRQGAGNYNAMCMGCHLAPGMGDTELSQGLYPAPPNLTRERVDAAEAFWVIKHGIKATGMPAWGRSMDDVYIWNMAAFLQALPGMTPAQYQALVESSGGHEHGGGETKPHAHGPGVAEDHHAAGQGKDHGDMPASTSDNHPHPPGTLAHDDSPARPAKAGMTTHRHADGTVESHPSEPTSPANDGHDHQH
ncbi:cytochrome c [Luteimonas vadosa]|uniref:Cytochrome c domain-containing protein n=1 Tax=Luteimonas vadosa TaxID=1165507 RepID=A0ABP9E2X5_9GAMM